MIDDATQISFRREMGLSHGEFFRTLPAALGDQPFSVLGTTVIVQGEEQRHITIKLAPEEVRHIALLKLPVTWVTFEFAGYTQDEIGSFMHQFERRFQRGGG